MAQSSSSLRQYSRTPRGRTTLLACISQKMHSQYHVHMCIYTHTLSSYKYSSLHIVYICTHIFNIIRFIYKKLGHGIIKSEKFQDQHLASRNSRMLMCSCILRNCRADVSVRYKGKRNKMMSKTVWQAEFPLSLFVLFDLQVIK